MTNKKIALLTLVTTITLSISPASVFAAESQKIRRPIDAVNSIISATMVHAQSLADASQQASQSEPVSCKFEDPAKKEYESQFIAVRKKGAVAKGEIFETQVYMKNTGNTPWFSSNSGCPYLITYLGTENERDRESIFYTADLLWESGWAHSNRINMVEKRVDPGEVGTFTFWSRAPKNDGYYREYFAPVIADVTWIDSGKFATEIKVGDPNIDFDQKQYWPFIEKSIDLTSVNLAGGKTIDVSVTTQKMLLKIGDTVIKEFPVSTGKPSTPSPLGTTTITHKQEVRVAGSYPHYIMPKWMTYRGGGYGIHALPSLGNDNGVFWREALNHIGSARSHGCIRLLPQDAAYAYDFADIGTTVVVHR